MRPAVFSRTPFAGVAAVVVAVAGCSAPCPEGQVYERGEPRIVWIYNAALKMQQPLTTYPDAQCVEARRG